jgi:hypothetical protein
VATFMAMLTEVSSVLPGGHLPPPAPVAAAAEPTMPALDS